MMKSQSTSGGNTLNFSDDEKISDNNDFINDSEELVDDVSLYRKLDPLYPNPLEREHYNNFLTKLAIRF